MLKEFKTFIARGNVVDLAVGVVIGAAFGKVVGSFTEDLLMPPLGLVVGKVDFSNLFLNLSMQHFDTLAEAKKAGAPTLNYGLFLNTVVNFLIIAFAVFILVTVVNRLKNNHEKAEAAAAPATKECPFCTLAIPVAAKRCPQCTSALAA